MRGSSVQPHPHYSAITYHDLCDVTPGNEIGDVGADAVSHVIRQCPTLQVVSMAQNNLTPVGYGQVAAAFCTAKRIVEFG